MTMIEINLSNFVPYNLLIDKKTNRITKAGDMDPQFNTRKLFDMKEVIYDKDWLAQQENFDLYYMYRDLAREIDKKIFQEQNIRFDITIIPPNNLGKELVKTAGHFHPEIKEGTSYPEVYEVMYGEGLYLLQKENPATSSDPIEILLISAKAGDQVLIPPGFGHITINPLADTTLVMNNLVSSQFSSIYGSIKEKQGAACLILQDKKQIKNKKYSQEIVVQELVARQRFEKPFYLSFIENPEKWLFLNQPWLREEWL